MSTQCEMVLQYMADFGSITSRDAVIDLGVMRLASRITDLKGRGYKINTVTESSRNRYGKKIYYSRYSLEGEHGKWQA